MTVGSKIIGVGAYVPEGIVTNNDMEKMMDTSDEWIRQRTGIEERRWVDADTCTSDLALEASLEAIENSGIKKEEIDMIVLATLAGDVDFPGTGCFLQDKLGIPGIPVLDIRQQCSGFIYALVIADNFIKCGPYKNILVVGAEVQSKGLDKSTRGRDITVLFGDGAGACVLSKTEVNDPNVDPHLMFNDLHADGRFANELGLPAPGSSHGIDRISPEIMEKNLHYGVMNGKLVFVNAVKKMPETVMTSLNAIGKRVSDVDLFLFHQANLRINSKVGEILDIRPDRIFNTIQKYGNTTSATIPLGMRDAINAGKLKSGDLVVLSAFGSGFIWGSVVLRF